MGDKLEKNAIGTLIDYVCIHGVTYFSLSFIIKIDPFIYYYFGTSVP